MLSREWTQGSMVPPSSVGCWWGLNVRFCKLVLRQLVKWFPFDNSQFQYNKKWSSCSDISTQYEPSNQVSKFDFASWFYIEVVAAIWCPNFEIRISRSTPTTGLLLSLTSLLKQTSFRDNSSYRLNNLGPLCLWHLAMFSSFVLV